jgi:hypothetical protein
VNQDGFPDLIVGVPGSHQNAGRVRVFSGKDGALLYEFAATSPTTSSGTPWPARARWTGTAFPT